MFPEIPTLNMIDIYPEGWSNNKILEFLSGGVFISPNSYRFMTWNLNGRPLFRDQNSRIEYIKKITRKQKIE